MDKNIEMGMLYDTYGKLLTPKQQSILEEYYLYNLSLREIAQNREISYQGVRDSIKSSETMLKTFEKHIGMLTLQKRVEEVCAICLKNDVDLNLEKENIVKLLKNEEDT